jgi:hypothetical protein
VTGSTDDWWGVQHDRHDRLDAVSESLWRERHLLGRLVFKFAIVRALLAAGAYAWLPMAADETAGLVEEVERLEGDRTSVRALQALAATSPEPWDTILGEHCEAVAALRRKVRLMASGTVKDLTERTASLAAVVANVEGEDGETDGTVLEVAWSGLRRVALRAGGCWEPDEMN